jgi:putative addiction module component (TIGR02574 family)
MTATIDMNMIRALPVPRRIELVQEILDTIAAESKMRELPQELKDELDRRLAWDEANPDGGIPWEQVGAAARARMRGWV